MWVKPGSKKTETDDFIVIKRVFGTRWKEVQETGENNIKRSFSL